MIESLNQLNPIVAVALIVCGSAVACTFIYQFWKTIRNE
jgi:hypothetical protein